MAMSSVSIVFSLLVITAIGSGCSSSNDSGSDHPMVPTYETSNSLKYELTSAQLSCAGDNCKTEDFESIGMVGMVTKGNPTDYTFSVGQCTGFLYGANNIVALNSHCITDSMWEARSNCTQYLGIKFPATSGHPEEIVMCEEILYRSPIAKKIDMLDIEEDYAFFRIKQVSRTPLPLATTPMKSGDSISVRKVNPLGTGYMGGRLDYAHCTLKPESILNLQYVSEWSSTGLAVEVEAKTPCKIIQGNSGSPVLNSQMQVIGFAQSYALPGFLKMIQSRDYMTRLSEEIGISARIDMPEALPNHFQFTQALCARSPVNESQANTLCKSRFNPGTNNILNAKNNFTDSKSLEEYSTSFLAETKKRLPIFLDYSLTAYTSASSRLYKIVPKCVHPASRWTHEHIDIEKSNLNGTTKSIRSNQVVIGFDAVVNYQLDKNFVILKKEYSSVPIYGRFAAKVVNSQVQAYRITAEQSWSQESEAPELASQVTWCQQ